MCAKSNIIWSSRNSGLKVRVNHVGVWITRRTLLRDFPDIFIPEFPTELVTSLELALCNQQIGSLTLGANNEYSIAVNPSRSWDSVEIHFTNGSAEPDEYTVPGFEMRELVTALRNHWSID